MSRNSDLPNLSQEELFVFHDVILEASGISFETDGTTKALLYLYRSMPPELKQEIEEHGMSDTKTRDKLLKHFSKKK